jgi:hypothetical protein
MLTAHGIPNGHAPFVVCNAENITGATSEDERSRIIGNILRNGIWELPRRVHVAVQHVDEAIPCFLARNPGPDQLEIHEHRECSLVARLRKLCHAHSGNVGMINPWLDE